MVHIGNDEADILLEWEETAVQRICDFLQFTHRSFEEQGLSCVVALRSSAFGEDYTPKKLETIPDTYWSHIFVFLTRNNYTLTDEEETIVGASAIIAEAQRSLLEKSVTLYDDFFEKIKEGLDDFFQLIADEPLSVVENVPVLEAEEVLSCKRKVGIIDFQ